MLVISGLCQTVFQGYINRHVVFNESFQLYSSLPGIKILLQALQPSFCQWPLSAESKIICMRFSSLQIEKEKKKREKEAKVMSLQCLDQCGQLYRFSAVSISSRWSPCRIHSQELPSRCSTSGPPGRPPLLASTPAVAQAARPLSISTAEHVATFQAGG